MQIECWVAITSVQWLKDLYLQVLKGRMFKTRNSEAEQFTVCCMWLSWDMLLSAHPLCLYFPVTVHDWYRVFAVKVVCMKSCSCYKDVVYCNRNHKVLFWFKNLLHHKQNRYMYKVFCKFQMIVQEINILYTLLKNILYSVVGKLPFSKEIWSTEIKIILCMHSVHLQLMNAGFG